MAALQNIAIPPFMPKNQSVWLSPVEAQFSLRHTTSQEVDCFLTVFVLPADVAEEWANII